MPAPILPLIDAVAHWPARGALIGLDLGTKTIGVAASDPDRRLATGVETIQRKAFKKDAARLARHRRRAQRGRLRAGAAHQHGRQRRPARAIDPAFARNFSKLTDLAIALWDERLSTVAVERELIGMDMSRARRAEVIDEHAAIFILQGALDRLSSLRATGVRECAPDDRLREAIHSSKNVWIASRSLSSGRASRGPVGSQ